MSFDPSFQGTKNYIADRDGTKIGKWVTYADAAQTNPVDGTGGAPASTFAVSTDSTMRGVTNFLWTHSAANRQGEGFSYDFIIDPADRGKVLQCSFEYLISSGTYADNDMSFWIYDVTNAVLIQPAPYLLKNSTIIEKFAFEFQSASNSSSYRLIAHVDTATATAYTVRFGNWLLGPQAKLYGSAITDPVSYTPTFTGLGTVTGVNFVSWKEGANLLVKGTFTTGTPTATEARVSLGFGGGNSNITALSTLPTLSAAGTTEVTNFSSTVYKISALIEPSVSYITMGNQASTVGGLSKQNGNALFGASVTVSVLLKIPIQGWSSSQVFSQDADTRVVAAIYSGTPTGTLAASNNLMTFPTKSQDTHAQYSSGLYTIPVSGYYRCKARSVVGGTTTSGTSFYQISVAKNGSAVTASLKYASGTVEIEQEIDDLIYFDAGQTASFLSNTNIASPTFSSTVRNYMSIERISGPSQIAASESVSALYTGAPATGTFNSSFNTVTYGTKVKDSHNAYSGGVYTIPTSGVYDISAQLLTLTTLTANQLVQLGVSINGAAPTYKTHYNATASASSAIVPFNVQSIPLLAGSTVAIQALTEGATNSFSSTAGNSYFSITRTGNF